jgi:ABC-type uncharacterized transport system involved in gliding motility auxiliary subunit
MLARVSPSLRATLHLALQVVLAIALFGVLQLLATRYNVRFDLTPTKSFVLSEQARQVAETLTAPVRITAFFSSQESGQRRAILDLLEQFRAASPHIEFRLADLDRSPALATKFTVSSYNTGVIEAGGRVLTLQAIDETEITNALLQLSATAVRTLCFLVGHGERSPRDNDDRSGYSEVAKALERENFRIQTIETVPADGVPAACTVLISAGPSHELLPGEPENLVRFVEGGGRLFVLVDPDAPKSVRDLLHHFGLETGDDLIVDDRNRFFGSDSFMPRVPIFDQSTYQNGLEAAAVLSLARTVRPSNEPPAGISVSPIAMSSPESWALVGKDVTADENVRFRQGVDRPGPLPVASVVKFREPAVPGEDPEGPGARRSTIRIIAFGDSDFATNFYLNLLGNRDVFMSTVAVLAEDPALIAQRRKGLTRGTMSPIALTATEGRVIFWSGVVLQPLTFVLIGFAVAYARRRQLGGR